MRLEIFNISKKGILVEEANHIIDDIDTFIAQERVVSYPSIQYQKIKLELFLKIPLSQNYSIPNIQKNMYAKITLNDSEKLNTTQKSNYYFFVKNVSWRGKSCVELQLKMDTLNTFKGTWGFDKKTKILREHKDRYIRIKRYSTSVINNIDKLEKRYINFYQEGNLVYENIYCSKLEVDDTQSSPIAFLTLWKNNQMADITAGTYDVYTIGDITTQLNITLSSPSNTNQLIRNIDYYSEGISSTLFKKSSRNIELDNKDWYLVYMSNEDISESVNNPIRTFLMTDKGFYWKREEVDYLRLTSSNIEQGYYYYIVNKNLKVAGFDTYFKSDSPNKVIQITNQNGQITIQYIEYNNITTPISSDELNLYTPIGEMGEIKAIKTATNVFDGFPTSFNPPIPLIPYSSITYTQETLTTTTYQDDNIYYSDGLDTLDRTNTKIYKIIKLPYSPFVFTKSRTPNYEYYIVKTKDDIVNGQIILDGITRNYLEMEYTRGFENYIETESPFDYFEEDRDTFYFGNFPRVIERNDKYESKLYHSDFFYYKAVYDSFSFTFMSELLDISHYEDFVDDLRIKYNITSTTNSRFLFTFETYITTGLEIEDFNNIMNVSRNNEVTIYNNDYFNYLRNGYNYDVKAKERSDFSSWLGVGLSAIGSVASVAAAGVTGGLSVVGAVSMGTSAISGIVSAIQGEAQREQNIEAKMQQLKAQSGSVAGSDDVDIMTIYSGNRMKLMNYSLSDKMRKIIGDLFYYYGYAVNEQRVPNVHTRTWFNFLQCELVFDKRLVHEIMMNEEIEKDIIDKYRQGVLYFWKANTDSVNKRYNFEQTLENIEISLK